LEISFGLAPVKSETQTKGKTSRHARLRGPQHQFARLDRQNFDRLSRAFDLLN
jgi:hypothetical protein